MDDYKNSYLYKKINNEEVYKKLLKKYSDYIYLVNNKELSKYINSGDDIVYIERRKRIRKAKLLRVREINIIEIKNRKTKMIYLNNKVILYRKKNDLRNILSNLINNNFRIE